jgi:small-conductance mechanosensitive channel
MSWGEGFLNVLTYEFKLGSIQLSLLTLVEFLVLVGIVLIVARTIRKVLLSRVLSRTGMSPVLQQVVSRFAGYVVIFIGLIISFQVVGINLGSLAFLAGALGLGLGFGLQNIISNFVSGLIILVERPIIVGDRIDVGGLQGDVVEINARSTKIVTNDNITIIIPNSEFISSRVINWSHGDPKVRFSISVGVAYGTDPQLVKRALLEVAAESPAVLKDPPPAVSFRTFAESSLDFDLLVWNETHVHNKGALISEINFRICEKFKQLGIEIPFPQRDIHIKSDVRQNKDR